MSVEADVKKLVDDCKRQVLSEIETKMREEMEKLAVGWKNKLLPSKIKIKSVNPLSSFEFFQLPSCRGCFTRQKSPKSRIHFYC